MSPIIPTAEPFFLPGKGTASSIGCLLTHGFTGTPKEMRWMGEYLNRQGFTVCGIRLTGHATRLEDMIRSRWQDWLHSVEDGYHLLAPSCEKIILIGLSMGGVLSLTAASFLPVAGVVAMSTPYQMPSHPLLRFAKPLSLLVKSMPKGKGKPGEDWFDKAAFRQHVSYPENPVKSAAELRSLLEHMRHLLTKVKAPVLLIHSRQDTYVPHDSMQKILAALGSTDKSMLWVEGGGHVITEELTRDAVFKAAKEFITRGAAA
jgi:carboxylesterase